MTKEELRQRLTVGTKLRCVEINGVPTKEHRTPATMREAMGNLSTVTEVRANYVVLAKEHINKTSQLDFPTKADKLEETSDGFTIAFDHGTTYVYTLRYVVLPAEQQGQ